MRNHYLLLICGLLVGCADRSSPSPDPLVAFDYTRQAVERGEPIAVVNKSQYVARHEWRLDTQQDTIQTTANPLFRGLTTVGTHAITLTGYSADGKKKSVTQPFVVGRRMVKAIRLLSWSLTRSNGQPWHSDGTGPDIACNVYRGTYASGALFFQGAVYRNIQSATPSLTWPASATFPFELANNSWTLIFYDYYQSSQEQLLNLPFIVTDAPANRNAEGEGTYTYKAGDWTVEIETETR